jgi:hypothetical protein
LDQERLSALEARLAEVRAQQTEVATLDIDEADVARAVEAFEPIWDVLHTREKERILQLLIDAIDYDGRVANMSIMFRMKGVLDLAQDGGNRM